MPNSKKVAKKSARRVVGKVAANDNDRKIIVLKKDIPFREGSAVYKRVAAVLRSKRVSEALKRGARRSTVNWLINHKQIRTA